MRRGLVSLLALVLLLPVRAFAVLGIGDVTIVTDPQGLLQQVAQVGQQVQANAQLVQQYQQQLLGYAQDAKAFVALPESTIRQVQSTIQDYYNLLQQGQSLSFTLTNAVKQYDTLFASGFGGNASLMQRATQMMGAMRDMGRLATQTQALYTQLCASKATMDTLTAASQAAPGQL